MSRRGPRRVAGNDSEIFRNGLNPGFHTSRGSSTDQHEEFIANVYAMDKINGMNGNGLTSLFHSYNYVDMYIL